MERRFSPAFAVLPFYDNPESIAGHFPSAAESHSSASWQSPPCGNGPPALEPPAAVSRASADHFTRALTVSSSTPESGLDPVLMK